MGTSDVNIYKNVSNNKNFPKLFLFTQTNLIFSGLSRIFQTGGPLTPDYVAKLCERTYVLKTVREVSEIDSAVTFHNQWSEAWTHTDLNANSKLFNIC